MFRRSRKAWIQSVLLGMRNFGQMRGNILPVIGRFDLKVFVYFRTIARLKWWTLDALLMMCTFVAFWLLSLRGFLGSLKRSSRCPYMGRWQACWWILSNDHNCWSQEAGNRCVRMRSAERIEVCREQVTMFTFRFLSTVRGWFWALNNARFRSEIPVGVKIPSFSKDRLELKQPSSTSMRSFFLLVGVSLAGPLEWRYVGCLHLVTRRADSGRTVTWGVWKAPTKLRHPSDSPAYIFRSVILGFLLIFRHWNHSCSQLRQGLAGAWR